MPWPGTAERGTLTRLQNISTLPEGFTGSNTAAQVAVDSSGRFLYASNRGDDSIAVFSIDDRAGNAESGAAGGAVEVRAPRHFTLDPGNQWLLVANQDTSNIVVFARNSHSGLLTPSGNEYSLSFPVCLVFG